jgi:protease I
MAGKLDGKKIAFLVAPEGTEQVELTEPWKAVESAGGSPELLSTDSGEIQAFNHLDKADTFSVDRTVADADASDYDGLVLPGGVRTRTSCAWTRTPWASSAASSSRPSRSA